MANKRNLYAAVLAASLCSGAAMAGVTDLLGDLVGTNSPYAAYLGTWSNPDGGLSDIDRIVVTAAGSDQLRLQTFGRCGSQICNWGTLLGHVRTDGPESATVRSISVDYNLGYALKHITLHRTDGNTLRFDTVTEFTDGSNRHDFEISGRLVPFGTAPVATNAAPAAPPASSSEPAPATPATMAAAPAPVVPVTPVAPAANPSAAARPKPWWDVLGVTGSDNTDTRGLPGDCFIFNTGHIYLAPEAGNVVLRDFMHPIQGFGPYRGAANQAMAVISFYHLDEVCRIGRGKTNLVYYAASGEVPRSAMPGETCSDVHPDKVEAVLRDDNWKVMDGDREVLDYGSDQQGATQAVTVIKSLALNRQCYFDRDNTPLSYWSSR